LRIGIEVSLLLMVIKFCCFLLLRVLLGFLLKPKAEREDVNRSAATAAAALVDVDVDVDVDIDAEFAATTAAASSS